MRKILQTAVCVGLFLAGSTAGADSCSSELAARKQAFLTRHFRQARAQTRLWANLWGVTWASVTMGQVVLGVTSDDSGLKQDRFVGAAGSALGLIPTVFVPPYLIRDEAFESQLDACQGVSQAEALLERYADDDLRRTSWVAYASSLTVNLIKAAILGPGLGHWGPAGLSLAAGIPLGALMIYTYPQSSRKMRERYLKGELSEANAGGWIDHASVAFDAVRDGGGLQLSFRL